MCPFREILYKTAKNDKKPYLYHAGIDMVLAKMNKASLNIYLHVQGAFFDWSHQKMFEGGQIPTKKVKVEQSNRKM